MDVSTGTGVRDDASDAGARPGLRGRTWLLLAVQVVLLGSFVAAPVEPFDALAGSPLEGARLEPLTPWTRAWAEPFYGPLHMLGSLSVPGAVWLVAWLAAVVVLTCLATRRPIRLGWAALWFLLPVPLGWLNVLDSDVRELAQVGLLGAGAVWAAVRGLRADEPGSALARLVRAERRYVGLGGVLLGVAALAAGLHEIPGIHGAGRRLVVPDGSVLVDLHAHGRTDDDANLHGTERLELFERHGYVLSAVTEHGGFETRFEGDSSYETLHAHAETQDLDLLVLPGQEFTTRPLHMLLLGVREPIGRRTFRIKGAAKDEGPFYGYDWPGLIAEVHAQGGVAIVAHWWTHHTLVKIPWEDLIAWGVDGFEVVNSVERAPRELIDAWGEAGMWLVAGSDFHGTRPAPTAWNVADAARLNPDGRPWREVDPFEALRRLAEPGVTRPVLATACDPDVPRWLEPPHAVWRYLGSLDGAGRLAWVSWLLGAWAVCRLRDRGA